MSLKQIKKIGCVGSCGCAPASVKSVLGLCAAQTAPSTDSRGRPRNYSAAPRNGLQTAFRDPTTEAVEASAASGLMEYSKDENFVLPHILAAIQYISSPPAANKLTVCQFYNLCLRIPISESQ